MRQSKNALLWNARATRTLPASAEKKPAFLTARRFAACAALMTASWTVAPLEAQKDPGPRGGAAGSGGPIAGLTTNEGAFFADGQTRFQEVEGISNGLGPRFNLNSCAGCHAQPAVGGSSPASNPQVTGNVAPPWQVFPLVALGLISPGGPVREIRFTNDGGVHDLFTIAGTSGAPPSCRISQPNFAANLSNIIFRIPTPTFGDGLIEAIPDATILANASAAKPFGIAGHENRNGNDGTLTRFGWKAQNKSLAIFSGEAYNVEMGITNDLFPTRRDETPACAQGVNEPNDIIRTDTTDVRNQAFNNPLHQIPDWFAFAVFMKELSPPEPVPFSPSARRGQQLFGTDTSNPGIGCFLCHTPTMVTVSQNETRALQNQQAHLFSDLLIHHMGSGLADNVTQGLAQGDMFRTTPLWGIGKRFFFMHDGRTDDLLTAIEAHAYSVGNYPPSEANAVIQNF